MDLDLPSKYEKSYDFLQAKLHKNYDLSPRPNLIKQVGQNKGTSSNQCRGK